MTIKLGPGLMEAAVAYLEANIQTHLTTEQAIWNDGIVLPPPNEIVQRDPDQPQRIANPPFLYVFAENTDIYDFRHNYAMSKHRLICWLVAQDNAADVDRLRAIIGRYGNVLWRALNAFDSVSTVHRMAEPEPGAMPSIDFGMTLTNGNFAMNDVRVETHWTAREEN